MQWRACIRNLAVLAALSLALVSVPFPLYAQDAAESDPSQAAEPGEHESAEERQEQKNRAADLRDAINENLVVPVEEDEKPSEEPAEDSPVEPDPTPPEEAEPEAEEEAPWYSEYLSVTQTVQSLPEKVPGLRGRGWIHFGRLEGEYGYFDGGALDDESGFNLRSLRGGLTRRINDKVTVKLELDLTDGDSNFVDLWARYRSRFGIFTVGNQRVAQTLVNQTSRLSRTFQEVPLVADAFGLGRRLGIGWDKHREKMGGHLTVFGSDLNDNIGKFGYGARFYFNPTRNRFNMFHLGISAVQEKMDRDARFRAYPETRVTDLRLIDTGQVREVNDQSILGVELAAARDSYSLRSEYYVATWHREQGGDPQFDGFYVQANWAVTGETFNYQQGKFLRIRPQNTYGAFEVALRYSTLDLNDLDVTGGEQTNTSVALNWYGPGNQLRVQGALIHVGPDSNTTQVSSLVAQVRVQIHW